MTKISTLITTGAVAVLGIVGAVGFTALADDAGVDNGSIINCNPVGSAMTIEAGQPGVNDNYPCEIVDTPIDEVYYTGTVEQLDHYLYSYKYNAAFGGAWFVDAELNFIVDGGQISTEGINALKANAPAGITEINITLPETGLTLMGLSWESGGGPDVNIDFTDQIVHFPETTSPDDALSTFLKDFSKYDGVIAGVGSHFAISIETFEGTETMVIHLPEGTTEAEALVIANSITRNDVLIAVNNNDDFSITVREGQAPVVNRKSVDEPKEEDLTPPETGRR